MAELGLGEWLNWDWDSGTRGVAELGLGQWDWESG